MTNDEVKNGAIEVINEFWAKYRDRQPGEETAEWERMCTQSSVLKKKYPLMEEMIGRMTTELIERAKGKGRIPGDFHRPPR